MRITFTKLSDPLPEIASAMDRWANDPSLVPFIRPNRSQEALKERMTVTAASLKDSLKNVTTYLIYADGLLIGEINYRVDPPYLYKKEDGTAWIGIILGEASARGQGVGKQAIIFLEEEIRASRLRRIELGVFEFNEPAIRLYKNMGYKEIGRIDDFTYWQGRMWQDIRMEKYLSTNL